MEIGRIIQHLFTGCFFALIAWGICGPWLDAFATAAAPVCDPQDGDPFDATATLQFLHANAPLVAIVIFIGTVIGSLILALKPDSQTRRRGRY